MTLGMLEETLQAHVIDAVRKLGGRAYHTRDSRRSDRGFPDLVIVFPVPGTVLFVELKSRSGKLTGDQSWWLWALGAAGLDVHVWRPADWPDVIVDVLLAAAGRRRVT